MAHGKNQVRGQLSICVTGACVTARVEPEAAKAFVSYLITGPAENESAEALSKAGLCRGSVSCVISAAARQLHGLQN